MTGEISRKIVWLSSIDKGNNSRIRELEESLKKFYSENPDYYKDIDFTSHNWTSDKEPCYIEIVAEAKMSEKILEVGCGAANILKQPAFNQHQYYGCDFSAKLISKNAQKYPNAHFSTISEPNRLPYESGFFNLVFSVYVLEHSTNPSLFLNECVRVLKKGGILIIFCPDFLARGRLSSQRAGFSEGTSGDKIKKRKYLDAIITYFDNHIKIPFYCRYLKVKATASPQFYINIYPTVFEDRFIPDVDAVYLTLKKEIITYLEKSMHCIPNKEVISTYEISRKIIYLKLRKK